MDQAVAYLLLAACVTVHVGVLLRVLAGLRTPRRSVARPGPRTQGTDR
jgi:hypothetical protein